ncbi:MAG: hypothetical protein LUE92_00825 [Clostridiales bacterium]|nr:hypothetical protein [Clostridiales bacterium]
MNNSKPIEWITEIGESLGHKMARFFCLAAAVALIIVFLGAPYLALIIAGVVFLLLFFVLNLRAFVEYDFMYFAEELRIVVIYNQRRRKKKMVIKLSDMQYMVKKIEPGSDTIYCCARRDEGNTYTLACNQEGRRMNLVLQPDPAFVEELQHRRLVR